MNSDIERLYREVMKDHYTNPRNKGLMGYKESSHKFNPSCGDDITIEANIENGVLKNVRHSGQGCLICCSSASVMCEVLEGKTIEEASELIRVFFEMLMGSLSDADLTKYEDALEEAFVYQGVSKYPARIKCAALPWKALEEVVLNHK